MGSNKSVTAKFEEIPKYKIQFSNKGGGKINSLGIGGYQGLKIDSLKVFGLGRGDFKISSENSSTKNAVHLQLTLTLRLNADGI